MEKHVLVVVLNLAIVYSAKLPDYIQICHRADPKINECIKQSVEGLRPKLISGMPELDVPSIEPMFIDELVATEGSGLRVIAKELKVFGGSNFTIKSLDVDISQKKFDFSVGFDHLYIEGKYDVEGKIMMIPIKGAGNITADTHDITASIKLSSELETKDGAEYLRFTGMDMEFAIGKGKVHLDNLFGGDKLIGDVINAAINLNFQYFLKELTPSLRAALIDYILKSANHVVDLVPYNDAFPL